MKKRILFILFFVSVICLSGCNSNTSLIEGNSDPEPIKSEDQEIQNFLDVEVDSSYDNIIVKMEKDSYSVLFVQFKIIMLAKHFIFMKFLL